MSRNEIIEAFENIRVGDITTIVSNALEAGEDARSVLAFCQEGMERIGAKFETGEFYLAELIMSAHMFETASDLLRSRLGAAADDSKKAAGTILLGTPKGDIHDLGKNIFKIMAEAAGFEVIDIGFDVPPEQFVESVKQHKPQIIGMSALLTTTYPAMKQVVDELVRLDLRQEVKIVLGGGGTGKETRRFVGADAQTLDASEGVKICKSFMR